MGYGISSPPLYWRNVKATCWNISIINSAQCSTSMICLKIFRVPFCSALLKTNIFLSTDSHIPCNSIETVSILFYFAILNNWLQTNYTIYLHKMLFNPLCLLNQLQFTDFDYLPGFRIGMIWFLSVVSVISNMFWSAIFSSNVYNFILLRYTQE